MTASEVYQAFIAGKTLPTLTMSTARKLLDQARSAILTKSKPPAPAPAQNGELMAMASSLEQIEKRAAELTAAGKELPWLNAVVDVQSGTQSPAPKPAAKRDLIADVQREFARAKELTKAANPCPSPRPAAAAPAPRPTPAKPLPPPQSSAPKTMPQAPTSTTSTPSANDRRLAAALLDEQERREAAALVKTRAQFNLLKPAAAAAFCKAGGKIV